MVTTRTLQQRRRQTTRRRHLSTHARARTAPRELTRLARTAATQMGLGGFNRAYAGFGVLAVLAVGYLMLTAQATKASYEIERMRAQQAQLSAQRSDLRYQEAETKAPANVDRQAAQAGLQRPVPVKYLTFRPLQADLEAPIGQETPDRRPLWQRWLSALLHQG